MSLTFDAHIRKCFFRFYRRVELSNNSIIIVNLLLSPMFCFSPNFIIASRQNYTAMLVVDFCVMYIGRVDAPGLNK